MIRHGVQAAALFTSIFALAGPGPAVDFLRGDANSDGMVSISDAYFVWRYVSDGGEPSACMKAMDADASGKVRFDDQQFVSNYAVLSGPAPAAPFPNPGPDEDGGASDSLPCASYEVEPPLEDPASTVRILNAVGGGETGRVVVTVMLTSPRALAGYSGKFLVDTTVVAPVKPQGKDIRHPNFGIPAFEDATIEGGAVKFAFQYHSNGWYVPPMEDVAVFQILLCLWEGAQPGEYPLTLESAELTDLTGRAILPGKVSGTLTVHEEVPEGYGCNPGAPPPFDARFQIQGARARPGEEVRLPFSIVVAEEVQAFSYSVDFEEEILECLSVEEVFVKASGTPYDFSTYEFNNKNEHPGSAGVDEGFVDGAVIFSLRAPEYPLPANTEEAVLAIHCRVRPEAPVTCTEVRFLDGGRVEGEPVPNNITVHGETITPETAEGFVFINGLVDVLPEIIVFIRGDSNADGKVDISDPLKTLGFLFLGGTRPDCFDAADANDDGALEISDPIFTLHHLFLGGPALPQPYPAEGEDTTPDSMTCSVRG